MGVMTKQVLGAPKKTVGDLVFQPLNGQTVVKTKPASYNDKKTLQQRNVRNGLSAGVSIYRTIAEAVKQGYRGRKQTESAYNAFIANWMKSSGFEAEMVAEIVPNIASKKGIEKTVLVLGNTNAIDISSDGFDVNANRIKAGFNIEYMETAITGELTATMIVCNVITGVSQLTQAKFSDTGVTVEIDKYIPEADLDNSFAMCVVQSADKKFISNSFTIYDWS